MDFIIERPVLGTIVIFLSFLFITNSEQDMLRRIDFKLDLIAIGLISILITLKTKGIL